MFRLVLVMDKRVAETLESVDAVFLQHRLQVVSSEAISEVAPGEERKHGELYVDATEIVFSIVADWQKDPTQMLLICAAPTFYKRDAGMQRWGRMLKRAVEVLRQEPRLHDFLEGKTITVLIGKPLTDA